MTEIIKKLEKELGFVEDFIGLIETSSEKALDTQLSVLKILVKMDKSIILLSTTRPCLNLKTLLKKNNIASNKILIFDVTGQEQKYNEFFAKSDEGKNVLHFDSSELINLSIEINNRITEKNSDQFVFIDSITSMLVHNKQDVFVKFIHSLLTKMRINKVSGLLISFENQGNDIINGVAQMCDQVIKV